MPNLDVNPALIRIFDQNPAISKVVVFGSRAKGTNSDYSDVDISLYGDIDFLETERVASALEDLPTAFKYDVLAYSEIKNPRLKEHIDRVGLIIYERAPTAVAR